MKVSELEGSLLDYWVARAEGFTNTFSAFVTEQTPYSSDWAYGGLIIEREKITVSTSSEQDAWFAVVNGEWKYGELDGEYFAYGPTPLAAAMRAYVASKFGESVNDAPLTRAD